MAAKVAKEAAQEARPDETETRAKRYAQYGLADMCARKQRIRCIF